jgi:hypothetical protein
MNIIWGPRPAVARKILKRPSAKAPTSKRVVCNKVNDKRAHAPQPGVLRVVSACSGMGTEGWALDRIGKKHVLVSACELKPHMREFIKAHHDPELLMEDVTSPEFLNSPGGDLLCGGFPCQPFSSAGRGLGVLDARGTVVQHIMKWISKNEPKCFVLENVRGLLTSHPETLRAILIGLRCQKRNQNPLYRVQWKLLNSRDYGVPQDCSTTVSSILGPAGVDAQHAGVCLLALLTRARAVQS